MLLANTFLNYFKKLDDPRLNNNNLKHNLMDILVLQF